MNAEGDTLAPYLFIICLDYVLRTSIYQIKYEWLYAKKGKTTTIFCRNCIDADSADDIALLANTSAQAESLLNSLEQASGDID